MGDPSASSQLSSRNSSFSQFTLFHATSGNNWEHSGSPLLYIVDLLPQPLVCCERENLGGVVGDAGRIFKNRIRVSGYLIANVDSVFFTMLYCCLNTGYSKWQEIKLNPSYSTEDLYRCSCLSDQVAPIYYNKMWTIRQVCPIYKMDNSWPNYLPQSESMLIHQQREESYWQCCKLALVHQEQAQSCQILGFPQN